MFIDRSRFDRSHGHGDRRCAASCCNDYQKVFRGIAVLTELTLYFFSFFNTLIQDAEIPTLQPGQPLSTLGMDSMKALEFQELMCR